MRLSAFKDLTRIEQTLFAFPLVLGGGLLSLLQPTLSPSWRLWLWVIPAFLLARISGMAFNQLIDRKIDAKNPRTSKRAIPSGRVSLAQARLIAWGALLLFMIVCLQINFQTALLALFASILLYTYSYTKRVHYCCHFVLGMVHFLGPVMAYTALTATFSPAPVFLGCAAFLSIVGTDIVYAIQDYEFDCQQGLFSIPACFGIEKGLFISACAHCLCLVMLFAVGYSASLPLVYYLILLVVGSLFIYFHRLFRRYKQDLRKIEPYFFFCNVTVSFSVLLFILLSVIWLALL